MFQNPTFVSNSFKMFQGFSLEKAFKSFRKNTIMNYNFHTAAFDSWATGQLLVDFLHSYDVNLLEDTRTRNKIFGYNPICETVLILNEQSSKINNILCIYSIYC